MTAASRVRCRPTCARWRASAARCGSRWPGRLTTRSVLDALEARYPVLRGTIRDRGTLERRPFVRFFACEEDLSQSRPTRRCRTPVGAGREPLLIVGAMAGG